MEITKTLIEVETLNAMLGNYVAKFSDGTQVNFHCKDGRSAVAVAKVIGRVLMCKTLNRYEVDLFRHGFAFIYLPNIQGHIMSDMKWWDEQDSWVVGTC